MYISSLHGSGAWAGIDVMIFLLSLRVDTSLCSVHLHSTRWCLCAQAQRLNHFRATKSHVWVQTNYSDSNSANFMAIGYLYWTSLLNFHNKTINHMQNALSQQVLKLWVNAQCVQRLG